jgi:hypothetical protein
MRDTKGFVGRLALGTIAGSAILALGISRPLLAGLGLAAVVAALLVPAALLALLLRAVQFRDRHAYFRLVRPSSAQAFPPAALGNSSGGRNVS